jgi:DNA helicase IV
MRGCTDRGSPAHPPYETDIGSTPPGLLSIRNQIVVCQARSRGLLKGQVKGLIFWNGRMRGTCGQVTVHRIMSDDKAPAVAGNNDRAQLRAVDEEQQHLDTVNERMTQLRKRFSSRASSSSGSISHHQIREEQNALVAQALGRLADLERAEDRIVFGRIDTDSGDTYRIGRLGISDEDHEQLVVDWRAPVAESFYQATANRPAGLRRRRHIRTRDHRVERVNDDVFDREMLEDSALSADGVLLESLNAERSGKLGDIVATIQADQDRIMRSDGDGLLIVEGAPGTGKTVVALHRAAYLLYRRREQLARRGILVIGPNQRFVRYIEDVLPALGETQMVLTTIGSLLPDLDTERQDPELVAALKGDTRMAEIISRAVESRLRIPPAGLDVTVDDGVVNVPLGVLRRAVREARDVDERHNGGRDTFLTRILEYLIDRLVERRGLETEDSFARAEIHAELRETPAVRRALNLCWMPVSAEMLFRLYLSDPSELRRCTDGILTGLETARLTRASTSWHNGEWSVSDVALLDEAAELLGPLPVRTAAGYEDVQDDYDDIDPLADLAAKAAKDREWTYGHLIVDEAQELTPMEWRMLLRRVPSKSATVVGDIAQRSRPGAVGGWDDVITHFGSGRKEALTLNYRTPAAVMNLAESVLRAHGGAGTGRLVRSVRDVEHSLALHHSLQSITPVLQLPPLTGTGAVIAPRDVLSRLDVDPHWVQVQPDEAKGLEFDHVVVLEPARILAEDGLACLYVALSRPTQSLSVAGDGKLPDGFESGAEPLAPSTAAGTVVGETAKPAPEGSATTEVRS